jgi:hypothetical protein
MEVNNYQEKIVSRKTLHWLNLQMNISVKIKLTCSSFVILKFSYAFHFSFLEHNEKGDLYQ